MRRFVVAALATMLVVTGCGSTAPQQAGAGPEVAKFVVTGGKRTSGPDRVEVAAGRTVTIEVTTDAPDELHVHGYDRTADVVAGQPAAVTFTADIPGVFEVELHHSGAALTELRVSA
ncbi:MULTISPECIES: hypothetical protein [Amycolatopsis]|uniref:EfeO-type cupredoxin-like domain-containing protein n=1 Tax=Amycolatopsis thermalba TaxID=944492 RepID=A0ABY4P094_9PSEU|nr:MULTISPECIES: hypothetical protein [Amycolatopsis]OXM63938.1 hypothetical protein CF166_30880 [Amycolatopsis sp. KNN50.9b]UQS25780.1 hypothetical protein L1857_24705 [Amycolatopsis thermalba]